MCFQNDGKTAEAARCIKSKIMTKVVYSVLSIDTFEQQCVVLKDVSQSPGLKDHSQIIGIDQYLSNNDIFEQKYLRNTKKIMLVSVTTSKNSKIFLSMLWFLILKD